MREQNTKRTSLPQCTPSHAQFRESLKSQLLGGHLSCGFRRMCLWGWWQVGRGEVAANVRTDTLNRTSVYLVGEDIPINDQQSPTSWPNCIFLSFSLIKIIFSGGIKQYTLPASIKQSWAKNCSVPFPKHNGEPFSPGPGWATAGLCSYLPWDCPVTRSIC